MAADAGSWRCHSAAQVVSVVDARPLDAVQVRGCREHRLADPGVVDQEQQVGGRSGQVAAAGSAGLGLQVMPSRCAVRAEAFGVDRTEPLDDGHVHCVVESEPLGGGFDECEITEHVERRVGFILSEHGSEDPPRDTSRDRCRVECSARPSVESRPERAGQRIDDTWHRVELWDVDPRETRFEGKPQRERVAATDPHDRGCDLAVLNPGGPHDLPNAFVVERSEWKNLETSELAALDRPLEHRGLSSRDHDPYRAPEPWKQLVAQPRIRDPEHFIVVDDDDRGVHPRRAGEEPERVEKTLRRRLDASAVNREDIDAAVFTLLAEPREQSRLPNASNPIDEADAGSVILQHAEDHGQLCVPADHLGAG